MALCDYILCCKCEMKLIYDGDRVQREWWKERFDEEPKIECPDCKAQRKPLSASEIVTMYAERPTSDNDMIEFARAIEAAHGIKENT